MTDELCIICDRPARYDGRCATCLAFRRRNGFDRPRSRPYGPALSALEVAARTRPGRRAGGRAVARGGSRGGPPASFVDLFHRPRWMAGAACRGEEVSTFILGRGQSDKAVRDVCGRCPVRSECLSHAMADSELVGVWGGTSGRQRRQLREGQRAAP